MRMEKHYTSLHTPLHLEELEKKIAKNQASTSGTKSGSLSKLDIALIVVGVITSLVLAGLMYMLYLQDSGGAMF